MAKRITLFLLTVGALLSSFASAQDLISCAEAQATPERTLIRVGGIVLNGSELGGIRYFSDGTGGYAVFSNSGLTADVQRGDSIIVTGTTNFFNDLRQVSDTQGDALGIEIVSSGNDLPTPRVVTSELLDRSVEPGEFQGELLVFEDVVIETGDSQFGGSRNYTTIDDNGNENTFRVSNSGHEFVGENVPTGKVTIIGIGSRFRSSFQFLPRDIDDLVVGLSLEGFEQNDITPFSFSVSWTTSLPSNTRFRWRKPGETEWNEILNERLTANHELLVSGLEPATFYETEAFSSFIDEESEIVGVSTTQFLSTQSQSSGEIRILFNKPVDNSINVGVNDAVFVDNAMADTLVRYIEAAQTSVEVAVFNANSAGSAKVMAALNQAALRGVNVRYVADGEQANTALSSLNSLVQVVKSPIGREGIMHNKFVVVDADSYNNSWVITGSMNWTDNNLNTDANNTVLIQDQAIARAFRAEFDEMFSGVFGEDKSINTPSKFMIGGNLVELYFSPTDGTTSAISQALGTVNNDIRFALLLFTDNSLGNRLIQEGTSGGAGSYIIRGLVDDNTFDGSELSFMQQQAAGQTYFEVEDYAGENGTVDVLHHKYAVVDAYMPSSDPLVVTGSHNWSGAAETVNDENTLIIHNADIAGQFAREFSARWAETTGTADAVLTSIDAEEMLESDLKVFPNPAKDRLNVSLNCDCGQAAVRIVDISGRTVDSKKLDALTTAAFDIERLKAGIYLLIAEQKGSRVVKRLVVSK